MPCCDEAAVHLIKALGGEDVAKRVVGGTKWWQVRGVKGSVHMGYLEKHHLLFISVDAQWIAVKKDYQQAKRRRKQQEQQQGRPNEPSKSSASADVLPEDAEIEETEVEPVYRAEMDDMRCILYAHGGESSVAISDGIDLDASRRILLW